MKKYILIHIVLLLSIMTAANKVIFFKLYNASTYDGTWNINEGLTDRLAMELNNTGKFSTYKQSITTLTGLRESSDTISDKELLIKYAKKFNANLIITGFIRDFSVSSTGIISPGIGGYKLYHSVCIIEYSVINVADKTRSSYTAEGNITSHDLGLTILGGPGGREEESPETALQRLEKLKFNSHIFNQTVIGQSVQMATTSFVSNLIRDFPTEIRKLNAKVIDIESSYVYINLGQKDNLQIGQKFIIYRIGSEIKDPDTGEILGFKEIDVALVTVDRVIAAKLCRAKILKTYQEIKIHDYIKYNSQ